MIATTWVAWLMAMAPMPQEQPPAVRFATFNVALFRAEAGELAAELAAGSDQARAVAEIVQRVRPDVLLLNEIDFEPDAEAVRRLARDYLAVGQHGLDGVDYPYLFTAPVNTGVPSGADLDGDGETGGPADALGYGRYPGQYGMAVLSRLPIRTAEVRTFRALLWRDVPGARLPDDPTTGAPDDWYSAEALAVLPLSSKSHWDVPIQIGDRVVHVLASHPTPPVFDGPEDRNGRRNADEIRLWADYLSPDRAGWIVDDAGGRGGLDPDAPFVILGDLNADPHDGDAFPGAIAQLLDHPRVRDPEPRSAGGAEQARLQGGANDRHRGDPAMDTAQVDPRVGNLRLDYVLPSRALEVAGSGVYWPSTDDPAFARLIGVDPPISSDHRLVWVDVRV